MVLVMSWSVPWRSQSSPNTSKIAYVHDLSVSIPETDHQPIATNLLSTEPKAMLKSSFPPWGNINGQWFHLGTITRLLLTKIYKDRDPQVTCAGMILLHLRTLCSFLFPCHQS